MTTAFVLSGGASLGAVQVGMAQALYEAEIRPELIVGTSVGAVNGAYLAGGGHPDGLKQVWLNLERKDVFPLRFLLGLRGFLGRSTHLVPNSALRRLIKRNSNFNRLEDASIPLLAVTTDVQTGKEVILDSGPTVPAILASSAIPGVFPPVKVGGQVLVDGGVVNNTPITTAIEHGATEVWVLPTSFSCGLSKPPDSALAMVLNSISLLVQQRLELEIRNRRYDVPVHIVPPPCPIMVSPVNFDESEELIDRSRSAAEKWLALENRSDVPELRIHSH